MTKHNLPGRFRVASLLIATVAFLGSVSAQADDLPPGLSKTKPAEGPSVETPDGMFMVPYKMKIPGTDVEFTMMPIPGGAAKIGSPDDEADRSDDEGPQVEIKVEPFWMGKTEVTWAEYRSYMAMYSVFKKFQINNTRQVTDDRKADAVTAPTELYDPSFTYEYGDEPQMPAVTMTQFAAKQYTKWLSGITGQQFRLPTEAEWEYACRAGTTTAYSFGDDPEKLGDYAWYYDNADESLHDVGQKKPNPWGLYDMHGNVWEWVLDEYAEDGYKRLEGKTGLTAADAVLWPTKEFPRVVRGGSWDSDPEECRSAAKLASNDTDWKSEDPNIPFSPWWFTSDPSRAVGFRLVRPLKTLPKDQMPKYWEADVEDVKWAVENRMQEGRGVTGLTDEKLPEAIKELKNE